MHLSPEYGCHFLQDFIVTCVPSKHRKKSHFLYTYWSIICSCIYTASALPFPYPGHNTALYHRRRLLWPTTSTTHNLPLPSFAGKPACQMFVPVFFHVHGAEKCRNCLHSWDNTWLQAMPEIPALSGFPTAGPALCVKYNAVVPDARSQASSSSNNVRSGCAYSFHAPVPVPHVSYTPAFCLLSVHPCKNSFPPRQSIQEFGVFQFIVYMYCIVIHNIKCSVH